MRVATCRISGVPRAALLDRGGTIVAADGLPPGRDAVLALIRAGTPAWDRLAAQAAALAPGAGQTPDPTDWLAPLPVPCKNIMCLGWNYADHAQESAGVQGKEAELPADPVVFTKSPTSVNGPYGDIPAHAGLTHELDWEVELGVIIGKSGRMIPETRALEHVFGYTVINDISARDLQFRHKQYFLGKSLDGACPMGPVIVTADEIPDPQALALRCWVNGELKQSSTTAQQIFGVARIISILSRGMTLEAGDIISTGTPSGVGFARKPPQFLRAGDVVECEIDGIGRLRNTVR